MLRADNIYVRYGNREVISDVSFTIGEGEIAVLLGSNGAGKTTLVRSVNGTLPLSAGSISVSDRVLGSMSRREIAKLIAVVAQENETRFPITTFEFVLAGRFVHGGSFGWESSEDVAAAEIALNECDLQGYSASLMNELSGGERQRVVLARALATGAKILLLDEPTANLDLAHQAMMFRLVRERCDSKGFSAVVITHDLNLASEFADQIMMLKDGRIVANGDPADVLSAENIREIFGVKVLLDENPASRKLRVTTVFQ
jgi:ABC-type cobalamin/Fe3+-siderophores transport system ATPase subunit